MSTKARNAITLGLFTMQDFVRPDETEAYHQFCKSFWEHLQPSGPLEQTFVSEIIHATWRLRRCSVVEASMSDRVGDSSIDPMQDPWHSELQNTVDRASTRANNTLRRTTTELRRLQTERQIRNELLPAGADLATLGLASLREITAAKSELAKQTQSATKVAPAERTQSVLPSAQAAGPLRAINQGAQAAGPLRAINQGAQAEGPLRAIYQGAQAAGPLRANRSRSSPCICGSGLNTNAAAAGTPLPPWAQRR